MLLNCARTRGTQGQGFAGNPVHRESLFTSVGGKNGMNAQLCYLKCSVLRLRPSRSECSHSKMHRGIFPERDGRALSYAQGRRAERKKSTKETYWTPGWWKGFAWRWSKPCVLERTLLSPNI